MASSNFCLVPGFPNPHASLVARIFLLPRRVDPSCMENASSDYERRAADELFCGSTSVDSALWNAMTGWPGGDLPSGSVPSDLPGFLLLTRTPSLVQRPVPRSSPLMGLPRQPVDPQLVAPASSIPRCANRVALCLAQASRRCPSSWLSRKDQVRCPWFARPEDRALLRTNPSAGSGGIPKRQGKALRLFFVLPFGVPSKR